jgi:hypothetical protein
VARRSRATGTPGDWSRYELRYSTWQVSSHLLSPGDGVVDASGWTQILLSANPDAL